MAPDMFGSEYNRAMMSLLGMGSVSSYVLEHSRVPTVIVRNGTALDAVLKPQPVRSAVRLQCPTCASFPSLCSALTSVGNSVPRVKRSERMPDCRTPAGCAFLQDIQEPHRMCVALDGSSSAVCALDWALANLVNLDKDELNLITAVVKPAHEQVRFPKCCWTSSWEDNNLCTFCQRAPNVMTCIALLHTGVSGIAPQ